MSTERCPACKGNKKITCGYCGGSREKAISCDKCKGSGKMLCPTCDGKGWVERPGNRP